MTGDMRFAFTLWLLLIATCCVAQPRVQAQSGVLDARYWDFQHHRLALSGYWKVIDGKLVDPASVDNSPSTDTLFPSLWNDSRADKKSSGYATYFLQVLVPDSIDSWAVEVPQVYSSFRLWVNEKEIGSAGVTTEQEVKPQWVVKTIRFETGRQDTLKVVLQIANFHHHKGGLNHSIYLGAQDEMFNHRTWSYASNAFESIVVVLLGIVFLVLAIVKKKRIVLYFSLLCLTWTIRSLFSNLYPITILDPDFNWTWMVRIEYLTLYFTMIWAVLFVQELFYKIASRKVSYMIVIVNSLFVIFTLFTSPLMFTKWVSLYLAVAGVLVLYGAFLVIRALFFEHAGAWFLLGSVMMGAITFGYDIISYQASFDYSFLFLNISYVIMFILTAVAMLYHLNVFKDKGKANVLKYSDLFDRSRN
jgi:hypothetical protein